jgi:hypothetical protein
VTAADRDGTAAGRQATVALRPGRGQGDGLAVKTYRSTATDYGFAAELRGLQVLEGLAPRIPAMAGWRAAAVEVVASDPDTRTITMTLAAGRSLHVDPQLDGPDRDAVCTLVVALVEGYWAETGSIYGDLTLGNILVDRCRRVVTMIDPGPPREAWVCPAVSRAHWPGSRDVGYLLFGAVVGLRPDRLPGRRARAALAWELAGRLSPAVGAEAFRAEAMACAQRHLDRLLELPGRRAWRRLARRAAQRRLRVTAPEGWSP